MAYNEADTRAKIIDPKIKQSGWTEDFIAREYYFTAGKISGIEIIDHVIITKDKFLSMKQKGILD